MAKKKLETIEDKLKCLGQDYAHYVLDICKFIKKGKGSPTEKVGIK